MVLVDSRLLQFGVRKQMAAAYVVRGGAYVGTVQKSSWAAGRHYDRESVKMKTEQ